MYLQVLCNLEFKMFEAINLADINRHLDNFLAQQQGDFVCGAYFMQ